ncbi:MAG: GtrA family protein [Arenimonas sp.]
MIERGRLFEIARFLVAGLATTAISYALYLVLLFVLPYLPAYMISYVAGIVFSYFINTYFVFSQRFSLQSFLKFPLVYIAQFAINVAVVWLAVDKFEMRKELAPLIAIVLSIPVTYLLSRAIINNGDQAK